MILLPPRSTRTDTLFPYTTLFRSGFRYLPCLSRELPEPGSPQAHADVCHGYVQQFLGQFAPDPEHDIAYLCGNPNMVDACFAALKEHGLPVPRIRRAKYVSRSEEGRGGQECAGTFRYRGWP